MDCQWDELEDLVHNLHHVIIGQVDEDNPESAAAHLIGMAPYPSEQKQVLVIFMAYISPGHGYEQFEQEIKILLEKHFGKNLKDRYNKKPH